MKRPFGLILHDIETILNPHAVLVKDIAKAFKPLQLASGSGKVQNLQQSLCIFIRRPDVLIKSKLAPGTAFQDAPFMVKAICNYYVSGASIGLSSYGAS